MGSSANQAPTPQPFVGWVAKVFLGRVVDWPERCPRATYAGHLRSRQESPYHRRAGVVVVYDAFVCSNHTRGFVEDHTGTPASD